MFFKTHYDKKLTPSDQMEFVNMWYVLIIINDALTVAGSILKLQIENKVRFAVCTRLSLCLHDFIVHNFI